MQKGAIICVDNAGKSVLGYEFMQVLGQGVGRLGCDFVERGIPAEEIADVQVLFAFVGEVASCDLLPWVIGDVPGKHGLCRGRDFVLAADNASVDTIDYICVNAGPVHCLSCLCLYLVIPPVGSMLVSKDADE